MQFLYFLENIRTPIGDWFFSFVTHAGEEIFFLALAIFFFWCVNKRQGYYILVTGLAGTAINQGLKLGFKIDRPWIIDRGFKPVESAVAEATGYSFPSGHTQNVAGTFGAIGAFTKRNWVRITSAVIITLVAFSRMYLGVHTPLDVGVSLLLAAALVFVLYPVFRTEESFNRYMPYVVGASFLLSLGLLLYTNLHSDRGLDLVALENLRNARKNAATLFGCSLGLAAVYPIDRFLIKFKTEARWYSQIFKLLPGLGGVLLLKSGLEMPLEYVIGFMTENPENAARVVRYFIIVMFAGALWPLTFSFFSGLRIRALDRFTVWILRRVLRRDPPEKYLPAECAEDGEISGEALSRDGEIPGEDLAGDAEGTADGTPLDGSQCRDDE